ncbi:MAG: hypothetical protein PUB49_00470 [Selenomonadaceae bacterium]|nr:hypothetical protein [Selenomonadaceae bacterium]
MAKQYKKLQKKVYPKVEDPRKKEKEKIGKDYLLIAVISFTLVVTLFGWQTFDALNRAMYVLLTFSLAMTYIYRHAKISENARIYVNRASLCSMGLAIGMFCLALWHEFNK